MTGVQTCALPIWTPTECLVEDGAGEQQPGMSMGRPESTQRLECQLWQNHISILSAFAVANVNPVLAAIDITNLELEAFGGS